MVLATNVTQLPYLAKNLTTGQTYVFYVEARNAVGFSVRSDLFTVIAATVPSAPTNPTTTLQNNNVIITWSAPAANGQPITSYTIYI